MEAVGSSEWTVTTFHTLKFYFIYNLLYDAVSSSAFTVSNGVMINGKDVDVKSCGLLHGTIPAFACMG
jgi:hypothetical protein